MIRVLAIVLIAAVGMGQVGNQRSESEEVIAGVIDSQGWEGHDQKVIGRMGDAAAVLVTKVVAERRLGLHDIENILIVLSASFADPSSVENVSDRQPRTTLFVLQSLETSTNDAQLRNRIEETRSYVISRYQAYLGGSSRR